jgi:hypothetical protein
VLKNCKYEASLPQDLLPPSLASSLSLLQQLQ